jgi:hypothetical protein
MSKNVRFQIDLKVLKSLLALCFVLLIFPWGSNLYKKPFVEDAWYGFSIARNIANGFGITIDGFQATNGFQPLQVIIDSFFYFISDSDDLALALAFTFRVFIHIWSAVIFANLAKHLNPRAKNERFYIFIFLIYLLNPAIISCALNGLETGLLLFLFLIFVRHFLSNSSQSFFIGRTNLYAIALIYTRIDMIIVILFILIWYFTFSSKRNALQMSFVISAAIAPWFIWNFVNFGSVIPISGQQQLEPSIALNRFAHLAKAVLYNASPWIGSNYDQDNLSLEVIFFLVRVLFLLWVILVLCLNLKFVTYNRLKENSPDIFLAIFLGLLTLSLYYGLMTFSTFFYQRYTILFAPFVLLLAMRGIGEVTESQKKIALVVLFISLLQYLIFYHSSRNENTLYENQVKLVLKSIPKDQIVGARQSGTLGYFRDRVINLDGKVNPRAPKDPFSMEIYLKNQSIDWLCDWPNQLQKIVANYEKEWLIFSMNSSVTCLRRAPT